MCYIRLSPYRAVNTLHLGYKNQRLMSYKAKVTVCSENTQTERNHRVEFLSVKPGGT